MLKENRRPSSAYLFAATFLLVTLFNLTLVLTANQTFLLFISCLLQAEPLSTNGSRNRWRIRNMYMAVKAHRMPVETALYSLGHIDLWYQHALRMIQLVTRRTVNDQSFVSP